MRYLFDVFTYLARIARVSYTHTRRQVREHVDTVLGYLIAPVFHRPRHCLSFFPVPIAVLHGGPVLRSGSTTRERKLYSFHYIFYLDNLVQLESLLPTRGVTFQKLVLSLLFAYTNFHIEFRIFGGCIVEIFLDAWNISSVYFSIAESNESRRRFDIVPTKDLANSKKVTSIATHRNFAITSNYIRANCEF